VFQQRLFGENAIAQTAQFVYNVLILMLGSELATRVYGPSLEEG
jgi:hypothetical protein